MIRRRICYLLLLAAGVYFIMLYNFQGLRFLFCCLVGIPLVSLLFLFPVAHSCRVGLSSGRENLVRGEQPELWVTVENRGWLPAAAIRVELSWEAPGEKEVRIRRWLRGIGRKTWREDIPEAEAAHCGCGAATLKRARVYDYLGIFSLPTGKKERAEVCILPVAAPVPQVVEDAYSRILQGMGSEREGDLLLRDFQPGDSLHRVYWKLTAKGGDLQVRDFERSGAVRLFLQFTGELREQPGQWDRYLDRAASLLYFFAEEGRMTAQVSVEAVWRRDNDYMVCVIPDGNALEGWLCALLKGEETGKSAAQAEALYAEDGWRLEEDCRLYFGEQCVYEE